MVQVPTNRPVVRKDHPSRFYFDPPQREFELCRIVKNCWEKGR